MSFAPIQSPLFSGTQSPLYQRSGTPATIIQNTEAFMLVSVPDSGNPPTAATSRLDELFAKDWADLSALSYNDITHDIGQSLVRMRGKVEDATSTYDEYTSFAGTFFAEGDVNPAFGYPQQFNSVTSEPLNGTGTCIYYPEAPSGYTEQQLNAGLTQTSHWLWQAMNSSSTVRVDTFRSRSKFNRSANVFVVTAEIWVVDGSDAIGWDNFSTRSCSGGRLKNAALLVDNFTQPANTFYEIPRPSIILSDTFANGCIGRVNIAVWFERKAAWETRTGITL